MLNQKTLTTTTTTMTNSLSFSDNLHWTKSIILYQPKDFWMFQKPKTNCYNKITTNCCKNIILQQSTTNNKPWFWNS
jgi:hypothetical protein